MNIVMVDAYRRPNMPAPPGRNGWIEVVVIVAVMGGRLEGWSAL